MELLHEVHLLHQVEGHAGQRLAAADRVEVEGVVLPAVDTAEGLGQLRGGKQESENGSEEVVTVCPA